MATVPTSRMAGVIGVADRLTVRCDRCSLVQFLTPRNTCRKCRQPLQQALEDVAAAPQPAPDVTIHSAKTTWDGRVETLHIRLLELRASRGWSQREMARRMDVPRTYISKLENAKATPMLSSLQNLADAFGISVAELLTAGTFATFHDPFLQQLARDLPRLTTEQLSQVFAQARGFAEINDVRRRCA